MFKNQSIQVFHPIYLSLRAVKQSLAEFVGHNTINCSHVQFTRQEAKKHQIFGQNTFAPLKVSFLAIIS